MGAWMTHYDSRYKQYRLWVDESTPVVMWLSGLHIPESFLAAVVQMTCRAKNWPLDKSTLFTSVTTFANATEITEAMEFGSYVSGLYLEGARWCTDDLCLKRQEPKVLVVELPILSVIPVEASQLKLLNSFKTPVYVTQDRRNAMGVGLVFTADLSTDAHLSHWVLQGVACCLNIEA